MYVRWPEWIMSWTAPHKNHLKYIMRLLQHIVQTVLNHWENEQVHTKIISHFYGRLMSNWRLHILTIVQQNNMNIWKKKHTRTWKEGKIKCCRTLVTHFRTRNVAALIMPLFSCSNFHPTFIHTKSTLKCCSILSWCLYLQTYMKPRWR